MGDFEGDEVGLTEGDVDGDEVGSRLGLFEGEVVGVLVGSEVLAITGANEGEA